MTDRNKVRNSPNFRRGAFQNLSPTPVKAENSSYARMIIEALRRPKTVKPAVALPSVKTDISRSSEKPVITWFGHSSYLIRANNKNILVDPIFSGHASPIPWIVEAFPGSDSYSAEEFPAIDILIITHDHYDHLDTKTVRALKSKIKEVYTGLGVSNEMKYIDPQIITELDWWEKIKISDEMELTALPARHFSGRTIKRNNTLWCSFALKIPGCNIYIGGDSGYDAHFKKIGAQYGPFDMAILECGQYDTDWPYIHMMPEQTVQAAADLRAKILLPVHWGKFTLANHPWNEPAQRVIRAAAASNIQVTIPMIGESVILNEYYPSKTWWNI